MCHKMQRSKFDETFFLLLLVTRIAIAVKRTVGKKKWAIINDSVKEIDFLCFMDIGQLYTNRSTTKQKSIESNRSQFCFVYACIVRPNEKRVFLTIAPKSGKINLFFLLCTVFTIYTLAKRTTVRYF